MSDWWSADPVVSAPAAAPVPFWHADPVVGASSPTSPGAPLSPADQASFDQFLGVRTAKTDPAKNATSNLPGVVPQLPRMANSSVDAIYRGLPFSDRLEAGADALGQAIAAPFTGTAPDYAGNLQFVRDQAAAAQKANPTGEAIGNFVGGAIAPVGALGKIVQGATTAAKIARGVVAGGGLGAIQGASNSPDLTNLPQVGQNVAKDATVGALLGGAVPAVGAVFGKAYRGLAGVTLPAVDGVDRPALNAVNKQIDASGGANAVARQLSQLGPEARLLDASHALTSSAAGVATGPPGSAMNKMVTDLQARQAQAPARLNTDITAAMGPFRDAQQMTDALDAQKTAISSALPAVYQHAPPVDIGPVVSAIDGIKAADGTPLQKSLAGIRRSLTQDATTAIPQLPANPTAAQFRQWQQATQAAAQASGRVPITDAETLHRAKQAIDANLDNAPRGLGPLAGADATSQGIIGNIREQLDDAMRRQVPGYAQTMDRLSSLNQQQEAIHFGAEGSLRGGQAAVAPYQFQRDWNAQSQAPTFAAGVGLPQPAGTTLSQPQIGQQIGMRDAMERAVGTNANDLSAARTILQGTPDPNVPGSMVGAGYNLQNIGTAFGPSAAQRLADAINRESTFAAKNQAVYQGSQTGTRLAAQKAAEAPDTFQIPGEVHNVTHPLAAVAGAVHGGLNALIRAMSAGKDEAYRSQVATMLSSPSGSTILAQVLANNAARGANAAAAQPVINAATRGAGISAAALGSLLAQQQRRGQLQGHN